VRRLAALGLQIGLLALLAWGAWAGWRALTAGETFLVEQLEVRGAVRASESELRARLEPALGRSLVTLDLDPLRRAVEAEPWVRSAVLKRRLPGTLAVEIRERSVGAGAWIDGRRLLVDEEGQVITPVGSGPSPHGPWLVGVDAIVPPARPARLRAGVVALKAIRRHRPEFVEEVAEVDLQDPRRVVLRLREGSEIWLPMERYPENLERFFRLRSEIERLLGPLAYADLRWENQIVAMPLRGGG
jgi:cell division protein FtsQ